MAISETAKLIASLELKDLFTKQVDNASKSLGKLDKSLDASQGRAYRAGQQIGTGIKRGAAIAVAGIGLLATQVALGVKSLEGVEAVTAQTNAVLKSTKDVSGQTADGIRDMANSFENLNATMDDTAIQSGANVLLTFTNITNKAFKPALQAALDLSQAMGQDLQSSVVQIGKALNDPIKGLTALTRVGVSFTAQQKEQIKALAGAGDAAAKMATKIESSRQSLALLVAEGRGNSKAADNLRTKIAAQSSAYKTLSKDAKDTSGTYKAQQIILAELSKEFGGSFLAGGQTTAGRIAKVKDAIDDLQRALAEALLPALGKIADATSKFLTRPEVVAGVAKLGQQIAGLFSDENLAQGAKVLEGMFQTVKDLAPIVEASAKSTLTLVQAAVGLFKSLPPGIQSLAVGAFAINKLTGGLVTNVAGGIISGVAGLLGKTRGSSPANPVFVTDATKGLGDVAGGGGLLGKAASLLPATLFAGAIVAAAVPIGKAFADALPDFLKGPGGAGKSQSQIAREAADAAVAAARSGGLPNPILDRGGREAGGFSKDLTGALAHILNAFGKQDAGFKFVLGALHQDFRNALKELSGAKTASEIKKAIVDANKIIFTKGIGGSGGAAATEKSLKALLAKFPSLASILVPEIRKVHAKMLGRQFEEAEFRKFDKISKSNLDNGKKVAELQKIAKDVGAKDRANGARLQAKVDALKATVAAQAAATRRTIAANDPRIYLTIPVENRVVVNARQVQATAAIFSRVFGGTPTGTRAPRGG
jgi:hypothetical protein